MTVCKLQSSLVVDDVVTVTIRTWYFWQKYQKVSL